MIKWLVVSFVSLFSFSGENAYLEVPNKEAQLSLELVYKSKEAVWGLEFITTDELLFTEKSGKLFLLNVAQKKAKEIKHEIPTVVHGQGGLMDVKKSPDFTSSARIYFTTAVREPKGFATALYAGQFSERSIKAIKRIFVSNTPTQDDVHFGSRITFDDQGHLFFGIGDRGRRSDAQDLQSHSGKVIRLNLDGSIPASNPFVNRPNALPEIYSFGHRNPQGIFFDNKTKVLWLSEHGPRGGDEINLILPGKNYGWPTTTYGREYWGPRIGEGPTKIGVEAPKKYFVPSIAPSSLIVVQSDFYPGWEGVFLQGSLAKQHLNFVKLGKDLLPALEKRFFNENYFRIRSLVESPGGEIFLSADSGEILKIKKGKLN